MNWIIIRDILTYSTSICTILQLLSGIFVCRKYLKNKSTEDASGLTFVVCFVSCSMWLIYGLLNQNKSIIFVNTFGSVLHIFYILIFLIYTIKKSVIMKQILLALTFISFMILYCFIQRDHSKVVRHVGLISCTITILFFASPMVNLAHVLRVKNTNSLPFPIIMASFITSSQWFLYGFLIQDHFIQIPNFLGCILSGFQLMLIFIFTRKKSSKEQLI